MSVFMLECESVSEVGSSLSSLVSKISEISSSVNGYDTSCEDGFDFASAKSSIAANIEACASKVQNTAQLLENVVSSHSSLQASIASGNFSSSSSSATTSTTSASSNSGNTSQRRAGGVSSSRSSGGSSGSSYSGGGAGVSSGSYSGGTISTNYISSDSNFSPVSNANELSSSNAADVTQSVGLAASTILVPGLVDRDIPNKDIDENDNPNVGYYVVHCVIDASIDKSGTFSKQLKVYWQYSSACKCSTALSEYAGDTLGLGANPHSQRSTAAITVKFDGMVWIEDIIEHCRKSLVTECQSIVKREDECWFAVLNYAHQKFIEDATRLIAKQLDTDVNIKDYKVLMLSLIHI